ncbi:unnamed protein product [Amoebophrya sp. A120]|nr:unnamed protein product [Amoebophrya sp. A120]|eukprot:GSA120T00006544001.1
MASEWIIIIRGSFKVHTGGSGPWADSTGCGPCVLAPGSERPGYDIFPSFLSVLESGEQTTAKGLGIHCAAGFRAACRGAWCRQRGGPGGGGADVRHARRVFGISAPDSRSGTPDVRKSCSRRPRRFCRRSLRTAGRGEGFFRSAIRGSRGRRVNNRRFYIYFH